MQKQQNVIGLTGSQLEVPVDLEVGSPHTGIFPEKETGSAKKA